MVGNEVAENKIEDDVIVGLSIIITSNTLLLFKRIVLFSYFNTKLKLICPKILECSLEF